MNGVVNTLLGRYDNGTLTRRDLVRGLTMLMIGGSAGSRLEAQSAGFEIKGFSHVQISASNVRKSTEFYQKGLGLNLIRTGPPKDPKCCPDDSAFLGVGNDLMVAIRKKAPAGQVDHFGFKVPGFNQETVTKVLQQRGVKVDTSAAGGIPNTGFRVIDPDGVVIELSCLGC